MRARLDSKAIGRVANKLKALEPRVEVDFFFSRHHTARDATGLAQRIADADIYVPELVGWTPEDARLYNACAQGQMRARLPTGVPETFDEAELVGLFGSGTPVAFADYPEAMDTGPIADSFLPFNPELTFDEALESLVRDFEGSAERNAGREMYILERLPEVVSDVIAARPELQAKPKLRVLMSMGAFHSVLHHVVSVALPGSRRSFPRRPFVYSYNDELERCLYAKKTPDRDLLARAYFEYFMCIFTSENEEEVADYCDEVELSRRTLGRVGYAELSVLYERWRTTDSGLDQVMLFREFVKAHDMAPPKPEP